MTPAWLEGREYTQRTVWRDIYAPFFLSCCVVLCEALSAQQLTITVVRALNDQVIISYSRGLFKDADVSSNIWVCCTVFAVCGTNLTYSDTLKKLYILQYFIQRVNRIFKKKILRLNWSGLLESIFSTTHIGTAIVIIRYWFPGEFMHSAEVWLKDSGIMEIM